MIEDRTIARTTAQVVVEVSKYLNAMLRKRISSVVARMIAMRLVKNNFNSTCVSVCAQAADDQRAPPRSEHEHVPEQADAERQSGTNRKTAARLSLILKIKNNEAGDGLAPDQRHEQIGANQHDGIVDDLAGTACRHEVNRNADGVENRLRTKRREENARDQSEQVNDPHDFTNGRHAGRRPVVTDLFVARKLGPVFSYAAFARERIRIKRGTSFYCAAPPVRWGFTNQLPS